MLEINKLITLPGTGGLERQKKQQDLLPKSQRASHMTPMH